MFDEMPLGTSQWLAVYVLGSTEGGAVHMAAHVEGFNGLRASRNSIAESIRRGALCC